MFKSFFWFVVFLLIFPTLLMGRDNIVILEIKDAYYIVNRGQNQDLRKGQILWVKRETLHGLKNIGKVRVIATKATLAAVEPLSESSPIILKIGDKLSLTEKAIDHLSLLEVKGAHYIVNRGQNQGLRKGQILWVNTKTLHGPENIGKVRVIDTRANLAAVKPMSESSHLILKIGDKLYLTEKAIDQSNLKQAQSEEITAPRLTQAAHPTLSSSGNSLLTGLRLGSWVEVKGSVNKTGSSVVADEIEEVESDSNFNSDKMEITGLTTSELPTTEKYLQVLDYVVTVSEKTRFENASRHTVPRFAVHKNEWVKVKVYIKENGDLFAGVIRRIEPRDRFKIFGQVRALAVPESRVTVGGVELAVLPEPDLDFLDDVAGGNPLESFLKDDQKGVLFGIRPSENLLMGGQLTSANRADDERDLSRERKRDKQVLSGELMLALLWRINRKGSFTFAEGSFGIREELRNQAHEETSHPRRLSHAYTYWVLPKLARLQIGRQDFHDEREWIYDESLDAIRLHIWRSPLVLELSGSFGREFLDDENRTEGMVNAMGLLRTYLNPNHFLSAYIVDSHRRDVDNFDLNLYGLRSYSRPRRGLRHWLELAAARGQNGPKRITGYAVDFGLSNVFDMRLRPTITTGLAYATGDKDSEDQRGAFHQTGLQDNNGKFGGVTSFRYYGEVFDPELSNRMITTLGLGVRPLRNMSTDLVFHTYHQDQASTDLGDTRLQVKPTGESKYLGWELDLILGYRLLKRVNMEFILGHFEPGKAFRQNDPAHIAQIQTRVKF